jgi:hypothetical protein
MNSLFSVYGKTKMAFCFCYSMLEYAMSYHGFLLKYFKTSLDIYDDLISRRVNSSDAEKFAEICPCPCNGCAWGVIWSALQFHWFLSPLALYQDNPYAEDNNTNNCYSFFQGFRLIYPSLCINISWAGYIVLRYSYSSINFSQL